MVDLRLFVCASLRLPWILPLCVCTNAPCAPHDIVFPMLSHALLKSNIFPSVFLLMPWSLPPLPLNRMFAAGGRQRHWSRSVSSLLSEQNCYRYFNVGICELRRLFLSEHRRLRRCWSVIDGKRQQRALARLSAAAHVSSLGSTMTGPARSFPFSSGAPVHAPLVKAASAKSSLSHARRNDWSW